ncbi:NUDIX hydrolase [Roseibium denhamense]|uniref:NUDIX domain-containing protein n=1 Tax=Roseibium denhamense TaxID=76305 RepID=A0ABY1NSZ9_9HYPH|nr:NUDIX hydrolase [Roseibium denhamense]MTI05364.1 NUDIX hydrolase [Roseibium denhamense]SMP17355.1 NUDIX domain-containing protein [Roseibium denhamense]
MSKTLAQKLAKDENAGDYPYIRPRDAATLLILDRNTGGDVRLLMGRRHKRHTFMPGKFVFPGGRVDPTDSRIRNVLPYDPAVQAKLSTDLKRLKSDARVRAFALAAIRETYEEAGIFVGQKSTGPLKNLGHGFEAFSERGIQPDLSGLRMVARAVTPTKRPRRFDTRFLAVWADAIADRLPDGRGPSGELEDCAWLTFDEARAKDLPFITLKILGDLETRLTEDPDLHPSTPVPYYFFKNGAFVREEI